ncbi:MAG: TonB-dependent receptor, partial [Thermoanaerobaculia bacterium]|nr:TonB-dependent receptor [Thermoanaerobaculia bacterium]
MLKRSVHALLLVLLVPALAAAVEGRVESTGGVPIEQARIDHPDSGAHTFTDGRGRFRLPDVEPPAELVVSHPRFHAQVVDLEASDTAELLVTLVAKQAIFEEIVVSANRGESVFAPVSVAAEMVEPDDQPAPPSSVTEMVTQVPGVSENGQGGLFQVYSVRGVSRQRILTLLEGT